MYTGFFLYKIVNIKTDYSALSYFLATGECCNSQIQTQIRLQSPKKCFIVSNKKNLVTYLEGNIKIYG
jgi:hypothetical protein